MKHTESGFTLIELMIVTAVIGVLAGKTKKVATIEEMNEAIEAGWAGEE